MLRNSHWEQWDLQEERRLFVELNNTYLRIQRGTQAITITSANRMRVLIGMLFYGFMADWWMEELYKLPNYFDV